MKELRLRLILSGQLYNWHNVETLNPNQPPIPESEYRTTCLFPQGGTTRRPLRFACCRRLSKANDRVTTRSYGNKARCDAAAAHRHSRAIRSTHRCTRESTGGSLSLFSSQSSLSLPVAIGLSAYVFLFRYLSSSRARARTRRRVVLSLTQRTLSPPLTYVDAKARRRREDRKARASSRSPSLSHVRVVDRDRHWVPCPEYPCTCLGPTRIDCAILVSRHPTRARRAVAATTSPPPTRAAATSARRLFSDSVAAGQGPTARTLGVRQGFGIPSFGFDVTLRGLVFDSCTLYSLCLTS